MHDEIDASFREAVVPAMKDFVAFYDELTVQAKSMAERFNKRSNETFYRKQENDHQTDL